MSRRSTLTALLTIPLLAGCGSNKILDAADAARSGADLVLRGGRIFTVDDSQPLQGRARRQPGGRQRCV